MTAARGLVAPPLPAELREQLDRWAETWLRRFTRGLELRAADPGPFNYPVSVFSGWRGTSFYLGATYRTPSRNPEDDFVVRTTRMMQKGFGRFDLAYFRHTGRWRTVATGRTANQCIAEIEQNELFWPFT